MAKCKDKRSELQDFDFPAGRTQAQELAIHPDALGQPSARASVDGDEAGSAGRQREGMSAWGSEQSLHRGERSERRNDWDFRLKPRFPIYSDSQDIVDYLRIFETLCIDFEVPESQKMKFLRSAADGKLLALLSEVPVEQAQDFQSFKSLAVRVLGKGTEQVRREWASVVRDPAESWVSFTNRMDRMLINVFSRAAIKTAEEARQFMLKDRLKAP